MARKSTAILLAGAAVLLAACDKAEIESGPLQSETREVDDFDAISVRGDMRLDITVGKRESLTIEARPELLHRITTDVRGDTLYVRTNHKDWVWGAGKPRSTLRVTLPKLESLRLQGGNDVRATGFDGGDLKIQIEGAVHIKGYGRLDELRVTMQGAGHADLSELIADETTVRVDGIGSVFVHPKETLSATMNGVGAIFYAGKPREVNTRMNGLGTIAQRDPRDEPRERKDSRDDEQRNENEPAQPEVDPDQLQPEYEKKPAQYDGEARDVI
jgi:hypothetical protein